ncbi:uncharacterized protein zgc:113208 isoform X1 [Alosa sapidissima]|uniref:uncharacterized protein zgc:113208 isoform X1 n=1 Tax=Alosa sapidissima TaxID=34773 RepID=UPI001C0859F1|nr:uncharacterized protein zgc:113208 isoform X1 [Alosa sapidissima]XP_041948296.1 uncharacterized protein zgc:113208 isoform X1 [Alosa sapidissima]
MDTTLIKSKVKRKSSGNEEETASKKKTRKKSLLSCEVTRGKSSKTHGSASSNEKKAHVEKVKKDATDTILNKPRASQSSTRKSKESGKEKMKDDSRNTSAVKKNEKGQLVFKDFPEFRPNMTPKEVLQAGSFGGTYFRPIYSSVTKQNYKDVFKELPEDWLEGLNISKQVASPTYRTSVNTYEVKCGGSLEMWESSGWIVSQDPYGWFQWYCRFYQGRRTKDDERQISRWAKCAGVKGRWRNNLITKIVRSGCGYDNHTVSPVVRQTLQHWGYRLCQEDYTEGAKRVKPK